MLKKKFLNSSFKSLISDEENEENEIEKKKKKDKNIFIVSDII